MKAVKNDLLFNYIKLMTGRYTLHTHLTDKLYQIFHQSIINRSK